MATLRFMRSCLVRRALVGSTALLLSARLLGGCGTTHVEAPLESPAASERAPTPLPPPPDPPRPPPSYEVHEWGLIRGNALDHAILSGPRADARPLGLAKPVLYFHRHGDGPLTLDVEVSLPSGRFREEWPPAAIDGASLAWRGVGVEEGACAGSRYPSMADPVCSTLSGEGCEAAELRVVESPSADCLAHAGERFNHLFYRAELDVPPGLPLVISSRRRREPSARGVRPILGSMIRVRGGRSSVFDPPNPGEERGLDPPSQPLALGRAALAEALALAGLDEEERDAFMRAWGETLFPPFEGASGGGYVAPWTTDSVLYVLRAEDAELASRLRFEPPPTRVERAIVVWIDLADAGLSRR